MDDASTHAARRSGARIRAGAAYLANFSLAKGVTFIGPAALGLLLSEQTYGALEFGLAVGPVAALVLTFGAPAAAMQIMLMRSGRRIADVLAIAALLCAAVSLTADAALLAIGAPPHFLVAAALVAIFGVQATALNYARASSWRIANLWIEHVPSSLVIAGAIGLMLVGRHNDIRAHAILYVASGIAIAIFSLLHIARRRGPDLAQRIREVVDVGLPIAATSLVGAWIASSGRIWLQLAGTPDGLFAYALSVRLATLFAIIIAIAIGAFSAELYKMPTRRFDPIGALLHASLFIGALAYVYFHPEIAAARMFAPEKAQTLAGQSVISLAAVQVYFLSFQPMIDMRIARARLAGRAMRATLVVAVASIALIAALRVVGLMTPEAIAIVVVLQQAAAAAAAYALLAVRGVPLRRTASVSLIGGFLLLAAALL